MPPKHEHKVFNYYQQFMQVHAHMQFSSSAVKRFSQNANRANLHRS